MDNPISGSEDIIKAKDNERQSALYKAAEEGNVADIKDLVEIDGSLLNDDKR